MDSHQFQRVGSDPGFKMGSYPGFKVGSDPGFTKPGFKMVEKELSIE